MAASSQADAITPDDHGLVRIFSEALNMNLKHSPPHMAADAATYAVRSYLSSMDAIDLSSKDSAEPKYQLVRKRIPPPDKRK